MDPHAESDHASAGEPPRAGPLGRCPVSLLLGLGLILVVEALLLVDVQMRGGAVVPPLLPPPSGLLQELARHVAVNMTPLCWVGYLLLVDGLLTWTDPSPDGRFPRGASPVRRRPRRFIVCFLVSVPVWLFFDWVNFSFIHAWSYHGLPESIVHRYVGYFVAFGAIMPAMLLTAQLYQRLGLRRLRTRGMTIGRPLQIALLGLGVVFVALPFFIRAPVATLTLWLGVLLLLDPLNHWLTPAPAPAPGIHHGDAVRSRSLICDWQAGRWGRTVALMAGGATCGFLWEFWNYWAAAKWTYDLPFLGPLEDYRYFEMPWVGFSGFLPFALECWVVYQTALLIAGRLLPRRRLVEPLPDDDAVL